jgi:hypothetical protein
MDNVEGERDLVEVEVLGVTRALSGLVLGGSFGQPGGG